MNSVIDKKYGAIISDAGTGKTKMVLDHIKSLKEKGEHVRALVVSTCKIVTDSLPNEIKKFTDFSYVNLREGFKGEADLYGINRELLRKKEDLLTDLINYRKINMLIVDESALLFRSHKSQAFKTLKRLSTRKDSSGELIPTFEYRYILTATLLANKLESVWSQFYLLDFGKAFGSNYYGFLNTYFNSSTQTLRNNGNLTSYKQYTPKNEIGFDAEKKVKEKIKEFSFYEKLDQSLLPELIVEDKVFKVASDVMKRYKDLEQKGVFDCKEEEYIIADSSPKERAMKRQISAGFLYVPEGYFHEIEKDKDVVQVHSEKLKALDEVFSKSNKVILTYYFRYEAIMLSKYLTDKGISFIHAQEKGGLDKWRANKSEVLLAQYQNISHGLNIQGIADTLVLFTLVDDYESYYQLIKRIHRRGSGFNKVKFIRILSNLPIDTRIAKALKDKVALNKIV